MAETKKEAIAAIDLFVETYGVKSERAVKKLTKDSDVLLTFYDFPAEHWKHIRTPARSKASLPRFETAHARLRDA
jgi:transposase-like protein